MKKTKIQEIEERISRLEQQNHPYPFVGGHIRQIMLDPECLHNGCNHEKNPVCHLYCPHCSLRF